MKSRPSIMVLHFSGFWRDACTGRQERTLIERKAISLGGS